MDEIIITILAISVCVSCLISIYSAYTASRCGVMSKSSAECRRSLF